MCIRDRYEYTEIPDISKTYLFGLTVKDGNLCAEYTTNLMNGVESFITIITAPKPTETPIVTETPTVTASPVPTETPNVTAVSYTHLDVYKRQLFICIKRKIVKLNKGFLYPLCIWFVKCLFLFDFFV